MLVGVPKEIKDHEYRVGLVPSTVRELTAKGHQVLVETNAGVGAGLPDADYVAAGAEIAPGADPIRSPTSPSRTVRRGSLRHAPDRWAMGPRAQAITAGTSSATAISSSRRATTAN